MYTVEVVISNNQTELGAGRRGWLNNFLLMTFLKTSWVSELSHVLILHDLLKNFLLLKIYEKSLSESSFKMQKKNVYIFSSVSWGSLSLIRGSYFNKKLRKDKFQFWWLRHKMGCWQFLTDFVRQHLSCNFWKELFFLE